MGEFIKAAADSINGRLKEKERAYWADVRKDGAKGMSEFVVKDSGKREQFSGGMVRDVADGKLRPDLVRDGPMFLRWIKHLTAGAKKYAARNWMLGTGQVEYDRALESADRHFNTWFTWSKYGINIEDPDNPTTEPLKEDHAAAVFFNINQVEYLTGKMATRHTELSGSSSVSPSE